MAEIKQALASSLKTGNFVIFDNIACRITKMDISKTGKHGHAKCRIEAVGLVDGRKIVKVIPGHDSVDVPIIEKRGAQVLSTNEDIANVMDMESYETFDLKIPEELKGEVKEGMQVVYWIILNERVMKQVK